MRGFVSVFIGIWVFVLLSAGEVAAREVVADSLYELRQPDPAFLEQFRKDAAFDYTVEVEENLWWASFWHWLGKHIFRVSFGTTADILWFLLKLAVICLIAYVVYCIVRNKNALPWGRRSRRIESEASLLDECPDPESYPLWLQRAEAKHDFVQAIRIHYLYLLYLMDAKGMVHWDVHKSNAAYIREIGDPDRRAVFRDLTAVFDCVCYGDFRVDEALYGRLSVRFTNFQREVMA